MNSKADLRRRIRALLNLSPEERAEKSSRLCAALVASALWRESRTIALFAAQSAEPDLDLLWPHAASRRLCFPRVAGTELDFLPVENPAQLVASRWDLREPPQGAAAAELAEIDLILVPGVAFTAAGQRLGRGGGYYDRFLAKPQVRAVKIGVCFEVQLAGELPVEAHDQRVDFILTEHGCSPAVARSPV